MSGGLEHGIEPVPRDLQRLGGVDQAVLWGSLSVGLAVLVAGTYLVPALGLGRALGAIAVGSLLGAAVVASLAALGARTHVPAMVLLRAPLGVYGSYLPTALNVAQGLGWAVFEVILVAHAARLAVGGPLALWTVVSAAVVVGLVLGGPLVVARRVLRLIGVPLTLAAGAYLTAWALGHVDLGRAGRGHGGLGFLTAVDLALAIPISWAPFAADYARFSRSPRGAFAGTLVGCSLANAWFYSLGALLVLAGAADPSIGLTPAVGVLAVAALALAETDKPFADLYSSVVSVQNAFPRWHARPIALALGAVVAGAALVVPLARYTAFLYLLGSCFVPLAGVQLAHAWRSRLWAAAGRFDSVRAFPRLNLGGLAAWVAGFLVYQWIAPTPVGTWPAAVVDVTSALGVGPAPSSLRLGASLPSFAVAFAFASALGGRRR